MISAVVFAPAAPWLIPGVAPTLLQEQHTLRTSIAGLIDAVVPARWLAVGVGDGPTRWDEHLPADLGPDPYRAAPRAGLDALPGSYFVARALVGRAALGAGVLTRVDHDIDPDVDRADDHGVDAVSGAMRAAAVSAQDHALLVTADGSFAHGERAPGAPDELATEWDGGLHAALVTGPRGTERWLRSAPGSAASAAALGARLPVALRVVLPVLADPDGEWDVAALPFCAPYGVGHHAVRWVRR